MAVDPLELLQAVTNLIIALGVLIGGGTAGVVVWRRKTNGQTALPSSAHDETIDELRAIRGEVSSMHETVKRSNGMSRDEHREILDAVAPRHPVGEKA